MCLLISAWVRYAATVGGLSTHSAYALLLVGQVRRFVLISPASCVLNKWLSQTFAAFAQPCFQVLGPLYSERWFDLKGRTTATMLMAICKYIVSFMLVRTSLTNLFCFSQPYRRCAWPIDITNPDQYQQICELTLNISRTNSNFLFDSDIDSRYYLYRCDPIRIFDWRSSSHRPEYVFAHVIIFAHKD